MKALTKNLLRASVGSWLFFAFLLASEVGVVPETLRGEGILFRWQLWLLLGILSLAARDWIADIELHCRCCGSSEDLSIRGVFISRELICRSCLSWDPGPVEAEYAELFKALKD